MISVNPGGGAGLWPLPSSHGDSAHWVGTSDGLAAQAVAAGLNAPCYGPSQMYPWHEPFSSYCDSIPKRPGDLWAPMSGIM